MIKGAGGRSLKRDSCAKMEIRNVGGNNSLCYPVKCPTLSAGSVSTQRLHVQMMMRSAGEAYGHNCHVNWMMKSVGTILTGREVSSLDILMNRPSIVHMYSICLLNEEEWNKNPPAKKGSNKVKFRLHHCLNTLLLILITFELCLF